MLLNHLIFYDTHHLTTNKTFSPLVTHYETLTQQNNNYKYISHLNINLKDTLWDSFVCAHNAWHEFYSEEKLVAALYTHTQPNSQKYIINLRKLGVIYRDMLRIISAKTPLIKDFRLFITYLGFIKDHLDHKDLRVFIDYIKFPKNHNILNFKTDYFVSFNFSAKRVLKTVAVLEKENLTLEELHDLRKNLRLFMNSIQCTASCTFNKHYIELFLLFLPFVKHFGKIQDKRVKTELFENTYSIENGISLDFTLKTDLLTLLNLYKSIL